MNVVEKDIVWLDQATRNRSDTDAVLLSFTRSIHGERLNITLYAPLVEELRWMAGDRIRIGETGTHICLLRINDGRGVKLSRTNTSRRSATVKFPNLILSKNYHGASKEFQKTYYSRDQITLDGSGYLYIPKRSIVEK